MKLKLAQAFLALVLSAPSSQAAVECRVYCTGADECLKPSADISPLPNGGWKVTSCDARTHKTLAPATVWYSRKTLSVIKSLPAQSLLAEVVADADPQCSWPFCFRSQTGRVNGGTYMGQGAASEVSDAMLLSGLPFDDVFVSGDALSIRMPGATGSLDVKDATGQSVGSFPASGGRIAVPATRLQVDGVYTYRWQPAGGAPLMGAFRIAPPGKARRAHDYAVSTSQSTPMLQKIALANAYMATGLRWNALTLMGEIERGE